MISIETKELEIEESLKKRIEIICDFCNITPTFINNELPFYLSIILILYTLKTYRKRLI